MKLLKTILKVIISVVFIGTLIITLCLISYGIQNARKEKETKKDMTPTPIVLESKEYVIDEANLLNEKTKQKIIDMIDRAGYKTKIGVMVTNSTKPLTIQEYGNKVSDEWAYKKGFFSDGVILIYAVKDPNFLIQYGLGLEALITQEQTNKVLEISTSYIRNGQNSEAVVQGVKTIIELSDANKIKGASMTSQRTLGAAIIESGTTIIPDL
jgi:uncharacterized membrane protein YgcG